MSESKDIQQPIVQDSVSSPENAQSSSLMANPSLLSGTANPLQHSQTLYETDAANNQSVDWALESSNMSPVSATSTAGSTTNSTANSVTNTCANASTVNGISPTANASTEGHPQVLTLGEQFKQEQAALAHNQQSLQAVETSQDVEGAQDAKTAQDVDTSQPIEASPTLETAHSIEASQAPETLQAHSAHPSAPLAQGQSPVGYGSVTVSELIDSAAYLTQEHSAAGCHSNNLNNISHGGTLAFTEAQPVSFNLNDHNGFEHETSLSSNTAPSALQPNSPAQNSPLAATEAQSANSESVSNPVSNTDSVAVSNSEAHVLNTIVPDTHNNQVNVAAPYNSDNVDNGTHEANGENESNEARVESENITAQVNTVPQNTVAAEDKLDQTDTNTDSIPASAQNSQQSVLESQQSASDTQCSAPEASSNDTLSLIDGSGTTTDSQDQDAMNIVLHGNAASRGIAFGRIAFLQRNAPASARSTVEDAEAEVERFEQARIKAISQLSALYEATVEKLGEQNAVVFQIHQMMLDDPDYVDAIRDTIREEKVNAEYAVQTTGERFADMFRQMEDNEYMQGRASDVIDVSHRLTGLLSSHEHGFSTKTVYHNTDNAEPIILATDDLAPSETVQLDQNLVHAILTTEGSSRSHTVIFARTLGLPAVINIGSRLSPELEGKMAIVDGGSGIVIINPDEKTHQQYVERKRTEDALRARLEQFRGKETLTLTGRKINLYANIGAVSDIDLVKTSDAEGIGLFRSEYIYLSSNDFPSEETQFNIYKETLSGMDGKKVVIRTLDIGADKTADYFMLKHEENPAMGMRAVRICLTKPEIFKTQLRALYRASVYGTLAIMFPMITSVEEIQECKRICKEVQNELAAEGKPFSKNVELGIMIETPASAIISDLLAEHVDFFSIGTNDLIQFTLAVDRQNAEVGRFLNPYHRAVIRLIEMTVNNAHKNGIWVGVCGELAADEGFTHELVRIGVDELSVVPSSILMLRARISTLG